mmetsp:Transcript_23899/g.43171  ORF Transcript_23899/g.43171 Transcript_23899/m.43171 type:complete len:215 (+) Transcript_23899:747-1391(+)
MRVDHSIRRHKLLRRQVVSWEDLLESFVDPFPVLQLWYTSGPGSIWRGALHCACAATLIHQFLYEGIVVLQQELLPFVGLLRHNVQNNQSLRPLLLPLLLISLPLLLVLSCPTPLPIRLLFIPVLLGFLQLLLQTEDLSLQTFDRLLLSQIAQEVFLLHFLELAGVVVTPFLQSLALAVGKIQFPMQGVDLFLQRSIVLPQVLDLGLVLLLVSQ